MNKKSKKIPKIAILITALLMAMSGWSPIQVITLEEWEKIGKYSGYPLNGVYNLTQGVSAEESSG